MRPGTYRTLVSLNRALSWGLLLGAGAMLASGYVSTRLALDRAQSVSLHTNLGYLFTVVLLVHTAISVLLLRFPWRRTVASLRRGRAGGMTWLRFIQRVSAWTVLLLGLTLVISGLGWYNLELWRGLPYNPHVRFDTLMAVSLSVHVMVGSKIALARNRIELPRMNSVLIVMGLLIVSAILYVDGYVKAGETKQIEVDVQDLPEGVELNDTTPVMTGRLSVGDKTFEFDAGDVETVRPDIFNPGYFSMFDALVYVADMGLVDLEYHFDESMNTYVIDSLEGEGNWWYYTFYDGGWEEENNYRMDHYPWKDGSTLHFFRVEEARLERKYSIFREEMKRLEFSGWRVVVPKVIIRGRSFKAEFEDVEVTPHDLRNDVFRNGTITALDVILSLGDRGELTYELRWYESIGRARIVKDYWVHALNGKSAQDRCGYVYEAGAERARDQIVKGFRGNHIHLPSDTRIINSPEYVLYYWICI